MEVVRTMKENKASCLQESYADFKNNLNNSQSIYDIVAACYCVLLEMLGKDDYINFIADISDMAHKDSNPYLSFRDKVKNCTDAIESNRLAVGIGINGFLQKLMDELGQFECPKDIDDRKNLAFCAFYIIEVIDGYIRKYVASNRDNQDSYGPLNKIVCCEKCAVYFRERESILTDVYNVAKPEQSFRKPLHEIWPGNIFNELLIISTNRFDGETPEIKPVKITSECRKKLNESKTFRIADIPFIGFDTFDFYEIDNKRACIQGEEPHGRFGVKYYGDDTENVERILKLLEEAIKNKANIIVFPEYVLSEQMLSAVQSKLAQMNIEDKKYLIMVFAGTNYCLDDRGGNGNNVLHVLSSGGYEIGRYYKYSAYNTQYSERAHGSVRPNGYEFSETGDCWEIGSYLKNCELLSDPGKECCLFDVDVIGRILPSICRDVIDDKYTDNLVKLFLPTMLMVSAWSKSISGFEPYFHKYAETVHTSSLLCNCCNAVEYDGKPIGKFVYPVKEGRAMKGMSLDICRTKRCHEMCMKEVGCVKMIDVGFSNSMISAKQNEHFLLEHTM